MRLASFAVAATLASHVVPLAAMAGTTPNVLPATTPATPKTPFRVLAATTYGAKETYVPLIGLARNESTYRRAWRIVIGGSSPPAIDFSKEVAVFLVGKTYERQGCSIELRDVSISDGVVAVNAPLHEPQSWTAGPPDWLSREPPGVAPSGKSRPAAAIAIPNHDYKDIQWAQYPSAISLGDSAQETVVLFLIVVKDDSLARELLTRLQQGSDFAELARRYSVHSTAKGGGYFGRVTFRDLSLQFQTALSSVAPGAIALVTPRPGENILIKALRDGEAKPAESTAKQSHNQ